MYFVAQTKANNSTSLADSAYSTQIRLRLTYARGRSTILYLVQNGANCLIRGVRFQDKR